MNGFSLFEIMQFVVIAIVFVCGLSFITGFLLTVIGRFFYQEIDPMISQILDILPGTNCGVCGYTNCEKYADAIVNKNEVIDLCSPGASHVIYEIRNALGKNKVKKNKSVAKIFCLGDNETSKRDYIFNGDEYCNTLHKFFGGDKACKYGCLGMGDCIRVCPQNAIKRDEYKRVWIDANICNGCKKCIDICPTQVIKMVPVKGGYFVACSNLEQGDLTREKCKKGCTACGLCEKTAGSERIYVEDNLARVAYNTDEDLYNAALKCPVDVIVPIINQIGFMIDNKNNKHEIKGSHS
jgi:Na+-translocating ferredoxin:NAD+ oxidoreductase RNF subunit RnfB